MKQNMRLFALMICLLSSMNVIADDRLKELKEAEHKDHKQEHYQGSSLLYDLYDVPANGIKGAAFAIFAVPCTAGIYIPVAYRKLGDIVFKKFCLATSNAKTFGPHTREELEQEVKLREFSNRGAKAFVATAYLLPVVSFAKYLWTGRSLRLINELV